MLKSGLVLLFLASGPAAWSASLDHSAFDALLRRNVVNGMVDYDAFKASPDFPKYLDVLSKADPASLDDQERLAYWINVYNAYTIQLVLEHQERESIRNINRTLGIAGKGPWHEKLVKAGGQVYHLDNVEHDIIRKQWKEPRIHFALVCAAMSCPPLRSEAYTGAKLLGQLADQARKFLIETPAQNRVDLKTATVHGSMIYVTYYREDFGSTDAAIGKYLAPFYADGPEKRLLLSGTFKLVATDYDWTLNSQEQARKLATSAGKPDSRGGARGVAAHLPTIRWELNRSGLAGRPAKRPSDDCGFHVNVGVVQWFRSHACASAWVAPGTGRSAVTLCVQINSPPLPRHGNCTVQVRARRPKARVTASCAVPETRAVARGGGRGRDGCPNPAPPARRQERE